MAGMDKLTIFIGVTSAAVVLQMLILLGMYIAMRKTTSRMEALAEDVRSKALPVIDTAQSMLAVVRPKMEAIVANVETSTTAVRGQIERVDATLTDVVDRTRLQVIRADEMVTRIMDRVESTTETVQHKVTSPVRHLNGLLAGVQVGVESFFRRGNRRTEGAPQDEMFI
jgi:methyl-accepting chemotaxis protein